MTIKHITLSEHNSLSELDKAFFDMPKEMSITGKQLYKVKARAISALKYQYSRFFDTGARIFWSQRQTYKGKVTYIINECLYD